MDWIVENRGGNLYRFDKFFYSRRVADMDAGLNLFGKVEKNTSIGVLGTYHKNNQNGIFRVSRTFTETANANAAVLTHHTKDGETNTVGYLSGNMRYNRLSAKSYFAQSWAGETSDQTFQMCFFAFFAELCTLFFRSSRHYS